MAGLVAAARARELGAGVALFEKGDRPGGSMLLSSGVVWRYRDFDEFRRQCPDGDEALQRLIWERLDEALDWLELLGVAGSPHTTNPLTTGRRFDPGSLTEALVRAAGKVELGRSSPEGDGLLVVATGGYPVRLAGERGLLVRSNPWSEGEGIDARARPRGRRGAERRVLRPRDAGAGAGTAFRRAPRSSTAASPGASNDVGEEFFPGEVSWSENDLAQAIAAQPGGRAWYELDAEALARPRSPRSCRTRSRQSRSAAGGLRVRVYAAVTHTYGGVEIDTRARAADGVWVAGVDAGGISNGGYASGLAQALVLGLVAAEDACQ